jgi:hypothetical protein
VTHMRGMGVAKRDWAKHLKDEERKALQRLDNKIAQLVEHLAVLRTRRIRIQNRATARAKA